MPSESMVPPGVGAPDPLVVGLAELVVLARVRTRLFVGTVDAVAGIARIELTRKKH